MKGNGQTKKWGGTLKTKWTDVAQGLGIFPVRMGRTLIDSKFETFKTL